MEKIKIRSLPIWESSEICSNLSAHQSIEELESFKSDKAMYKKFPPMGLLLTTAGYDISPINDHKDCVHNKNVDWMICSKCGIKYCENCAPLSLKRDGIMCPVCKK